MNDLIFVRVVKDDDVYLVPISRVRLVCRHERVERNDIVVLDDDSNYEVEGFSNGCFSGNFKDALISFDGYALSYYTFYANR